MLRGSLISFDINDVVRFLAVKYKSVERESINQARFLKFEWVGQRGLLKSPWTGFFRLVCNKNEVRTHCREGTPEQREKREYSPYLLLVPSSRRSPVQQIRLPACVHCLLVTIIVERCNGRAETRNNVTFPQKKSTVQTLYPDNDDLTWVSGSEEMDITIFALAYLCHRSHFWSMYIFWLGETKKADPKTEKQKILSMLGKLV